MTERSRVMWTTTAAGSIVAALCLVGVPSELHDVVSVIVVAAVAVPAAMTAAIVSWRMYRHALLVRGLDRLARPAVLRGVRVRELPGGGTPFVAGVRSPRIYWPRALGGALTTDEILAVLLHEQYHQLDRAPVKLIALEAVAILAGRTRHMRALLVRHAADLEIAADRYSLEKGATRPALASALLKFIATPSARPSTGFASAVDLRLEALLEPDDADRYEQRHLAGPLARLSLWIVAWLGVVLACLVALIVA
jgi:beta-lactamase regulating signal transducer with metallopeptidase domain